MKRTPALILAAALLLIAPHRAPAPISEVETPTPAPQQSAKPKPKQAIEPKTTRANSEKSTKRQTPSPTPKSRPTPTQKRFAGTWRGNLDNADLTVVINAIESFATATIGGSFPSPQDGPARISDNTISWHWMLATWTMTLNQDGQKAQITANSIFGHCRGMVEKGRVSQ